MTRVAPSLHAAAVRGAPKPRAAATRAASAACGRTIPRSHQIALAASAAALLKSTFDALLEALLRDGEARVRRAAARALWVLGKGNVAPERAKAMAAALDGEALFTLEGHGDGVTSVCFSPDGKQVASGSADSMARLWLLM